MDFDEQKFKEFFLKDRFAYTNGITLEKVTPGYSEAKMVVTENHLNGVGIVMGGALYTLADFAFAAATNSKGFATVTTNSSINFFSSAKGKVLKAVAKEVFSSNRLTTVDVDIFDEDETLIARYVGNGYILKNKPL